MTSPFANYPVLERSFIPANPIARSASNPPRPAPAKRGRKPKAVTTDSPRLSSQGSLPASSQPIQSQWSSTQGTPAPLAASTSSTFPIATPSSSSPVATQELPPAASQSVLASLPGVVAATPSVTRDGTPVIARPGVPGEDDVEGEDELLPAMADDDYSAQLSFQSQSKDNLKYARHFFVAYRVD